MTKSLSLASVSTVSRVLAAVACAVACQASLAVEAGQPAPPLTVTAQKGGQLNLADFKGKVVYLDFWASWCGPCKQSFPFMNEMQTKYGAKGFQVVGVNLDPKREDADGFLAKVPANFTIGFDPKGESPKRYAVAGMPTSLLIGADGKVREVHSGFHEDQRKSIEAAIVAALGAAGK
jgi:cytochrome c biogenesis protein CcmG, thiol:disulfide interchange protein DsbE